MGCERDRGRASEGERAEGGGVEVDITNDEVISKNRAGQRMAMHVMFRIPTNPYRCNRRAPKKCELCGRFVVVCVQWRLKKCFSTHDLALFCFAMDSVSSRCVHHSAISSFDTRFACVRIMCGGQNLLRIGNFDRKLNFEQKVFRRCATEHKYTTSNECATSMTAT